MNRRRAAMAALGVLTSVGLLSVLFTQIEFDEFQRALSSVSVPILLMSLISRGFGFLFMGLRTRALIGPKGPTKDLVKSHLAGFAGNNILPFRLGEFIRIDWQSRATGISRSHLLATAGIERLLDLFVLFSLFVVVAPLAIGEVPRSGILLGLAVALVVGPLVLVLVTRFSDRVIALTAWLLQPLGERISSFVTERSAAFLEGLRSLSSPRQMGLAAALSVAYWSMTLVSIRIWISAFGLDLPWYAPFFVTGFLAFGTALPSAPGFVGTWHYLCRTALVYMGVKETTAVAFAFVGHFMAVVPFTIIALGWLGWSGVKTGLELLDESEEDGGSDE